MKRQALDSLTHTVVFNQDGDDVSDSFNSAGALNTGVLSDILVSGNNSFNTTIIHFNKDDNSGE